MANDIGLISEISEDQRIDLLADILLEIALEENQNESAD